MHFDRRLTWTKHIKTKRKELDLKLRKMYWLIGRKSKLSLNIYKTILKPVWTYGIQLWRTASNSNLEIMQRFQSKTLRILLDAPWYVSNATIHRDLGINTVTNEIQRSSERYEGRIQTHSNELARAVLDPNQITRRLKRFKPIDLPERFK